MQSNTESCGMLVMIEDDANTQCVQSYTEIPAVAIPHPYMGTAQRLALPIHISRYQQTDFLVKMCFQSI